MPAIFPVQTHFSPQDHHIMILQSVYHDVIVSFILQTERWKNRAFEASAEIWALPS